MSEIPEYNKIDSNNDTIQVMEAKIAAIRKQRQSEHNDPKDDPDKSSDESES